MLSVQDQTVSFFLPLLRLRLRTFLPFIVAILLRKPCTLLRWRFFGWYVLFIFIPLYSLKSFFTHRKANLLYSKIYAVSMKCKIREMSFRTHQNKHFWQRTRVFSICFTNSLIVGKTYTHKKGQNVKNIRKIAFCW